MGEAVQDSRANSGDEVDNTLEEEDSDYSRTDSEMGMVRKRLTTTPI